MCLWGVLWHEFCVFSSTDFVRESAMMNIVRHADLMPEGLNGKPKFPQLGIEEAANSEYLQVFGNTIHRSAFVAWDHVKMGTGNVIGPYACIGYDAQHISAKSSGKVIIGNNNTLREFSTIHRPTDPNIGTTIGNGNYIMAGANINHDCNLEDNIVLCNNATLAGHVYVMSSAFLSMNCSVHQNQIIGSWTIIGMNSCVTKSAIVEPGYKYFGVPARRRAENTVSLRRNEVTRDQLRAAKDKFSTLREERNIARTGSLKLRKERR